MCFILVDLFKNFVYTSVKAITKHFIKRQHEHEAGRNEWCGQGIALYRYLTNHRHSPSIDIYRRIRQFKKYHLNMVKNIVVILKNETQEFLRGVVFQVIKEQLYPRKDISSRNIIFSQFLQKIFRVFRNSQGIRCEYQWSLTKFDRTVVYISLYKVKTKLEYSPFPKIFEELAVCIPLDMMLDMFSLGKPQTRPQIFILSIPYVYFIRDPPPPPLVHSFATVIFFFLCRR